MVPLTKRTDGFGFTVVGSAGHCPGPSVPGTGGSVLNCLLGWGLGRLSQQQLASFVPPKPSPPASCWEGFPAGTSSSLRPRVLTATAQSGTVGLPRTPSALSGGTRWELGSSPLLWGPFRILRGHLLRNPVSWSSISLSRLQRVDSQLLPHLFSPPFRVRSGQLFPDLSSGYSAPPSMLSHFAPTSSTLREKVDFSNF